VGGKNNPKKQAYKDWTYRNTKRGFIVTKIGAIFKPSNLKLRVNRNTMWAPNCTKEDIYQKLMNHIIIMKERYPHTDGYICHYCKSPWTFKTNFTERKKSKISKRSKMDPTKDKNFSIDRWDPTITYDIENIRFCCLGCNNRKSSSTPLDWKNFQEGEDDLN